MIKKMENDILCFMPCDDLTKYNGLCRCEGKPKYNWKLPETKELIGTIDIFVSGDVVISQEASEQLKTLGHHEGFKEYLITDLGVFEYGSENKVENLKGNFVKIFNIIQ